MQEQVRIDHLSVYHFFYKTSRTTREYKGSLTLIRAYFFTSNVSNLFYRSTAREGCIKRRMGMVVCGNMQCLGQHM